MSTQTFIRLWKAKSRPAKDDKPGFRRLTLSGKQAIAAFDLFESDARPLFPSASLAYDPGDDATATLFVLTARPFEVTDLPVH